MGDSEYLTLNSTNDFTLLTKETGELSLKVAIDKYGDPGSGTGTIYYRTSTSLVLCEEEEWIGINEGEEIESLGWVQIKVSNP